jgi:hypothetical protein
MRWQMMILVVVGSMVAAPAEAQRAGGAMRGGGVVGSFHGPTFAGRPGFPIGPFRGNFGFRRFRNFGGFGAFWLPWDYGWDYPWEYWDLPSFRDDWYANRYRGVPQSNESYDGPAQNGSTAPVIIVRSDQPAPTRPSQPPKLIEVPTDKESSPSATQPPTLFVLTNGTRLESHRYLLSARSLQIDMDNEQRTIPIRELDLRQTIAANRERGIELKVPHSTSEVFLGF